jgi:hypothetical protein
MAIILLKIQQIQDQKKEKELLQHKYESKMIKMRIENATLELVLALKTMKNEELQQELEAKRRQLHDASEQLHDASEQFQFRIDQLKFELKATQMDNSNLRQAQSDQIETLMQGFEEERRHGQDKYEQSKYAIEQLKYELIISQKQLEPFLNQEQINQKTIDYQNKLTSAVEERNLEKVSSILKISETNIDLEMAFEEKQFEGPILTLAIQNGDFEMIKMLIEDFGANVNQKITWSKNPSNLLILAMAACFEK